METNRRFVPLTHAGVLVPNYYQPRIDQGTFQDIVPNLHSPFWTDIVVFCQTTWPYDGKECRWRVEPGAAAIFVKYSQDFMLLKLALSV